MSESGQIANSFDVLRRFARRPSPAEHCELCSQELAVQHQHLLEPATRKLVCACDACARRHGGPKASSKKRQPRQGSQLDPVLSPFKQGIEHEPCNSAGRGTRAK